MQYKLINYMFSSLFYEQYTRGKEGGGLKTSEIHQEVCFILKSTRQ